jgi:hypothetical protein
MIGGIGRQEMDRACFETPKALEKHGSEEVRRRR